MADTKDPNSNITTVFKQSVKPSESVRNVAQQDPSESERVRNAVRSGTNAKMPSLNKSRIKKPTKK